MQFISFWFAYLNLSETSVLVDNRVLSIAACGMKMTCTEALWMQNLSLD
jgi:hypothetical protein